MEYLKWRLTSVFLVYVLGGFLLYASALDSVFTYDDVHQITQNPSIRSLTSIPAFFTVSTAASRSPAEAQHYRPLLLSTFAVNYWLGGLNPLSYHLVNLAFHIGSAFLVFLIANSMLVSLFPGLVAGLVMLAHPFNSEVVNYVTARSSVMATFFYLLAFYAYIQYRPCDQKSGYGDRKGEGRRWFYLSCGAFVLGVLTKEILITLPLILLLYEWLFISPVEDRYWRRLACRVIPFLSLSLIYVIARKLIIGVVVPGATGRPLIENLPVQVQTLGRIWQMLLIPFNLSIEHSVPVAGPVLNMALMGSIILLVILMAVMGWLWQSQSHTARVMGFFLSWFYVTLLPTTLIPLNAVLQENRGYIAAVAFACILGILVMWVVSSLKGRGRPVAWGVLGLVLILYTIGVWDRNRVWGDEVTLWQDAVQKAPGAYGPHFGLGSAYQRRGRLDMAEGEFLAALQINDLDPVLHNDLGTLYSETGRQGPALLEYQKALRLAPDYDLANSNLGHLYKQEGQTTQAIQSVMRAVQANPANETAIIELGDIYQKQGEHGKAKMLYLSALEGNPNLVRVLMQAGLLYQRNGDHEAAIRAFKRVVRLDPSLADAHLSLGREYVITGRPREAVNAFEQALSFRPEDGFGYLTLGKLYERMGHIDKAKSLYRKVLDLDPAVGSNQAAASLARNELEQLR